VYCNARLDGLDGVADLGHTTLHRHYHRQRITVLRSKIPTVSTGAPIRWENPTPTEHTITHVGCLEDSAGCAFDSGIVLPNDTYTHPGLAPGKYQYLCRIHPIMHGTIIVTDSSSAPSQL
jgi:plastocyanin